MKRGRDKNEWMPDASLFNARCVKPVFWDGIVSVYKSRYSTVFTKLLILAENPCCERELSDAVMDSANYVCDIWFNDKELSILSRRSIVCFFRLTFLVEVTSLYMRCSQGRRQRVARLHHLGIYKI
jgi:hypothetical protein